MKKTLLLVAFTCFTSFLYSQPFTLSGVLCNRTSVAIKNASVQLLNNDSSLVSSVWSDSDGKFSLSCGKGDFRLFINAHGFSQRIIGLRNISRHTNLDTIRLDSLQLELSEVVVKGNHHVRKEDRILIFPTSEQKKYSNDGYMLLSKMVLPKIQVDPLSGAISALGGKVTLCINGREVTQQEIRTLLPKDVLRVEYHDSPRGEFADKDMVIDFITVRWASGGYINLQADQTLKTGNYSFTGKANHKKSEFTVMYHSGYLNDDKVYANRMEQFNNGVVQQSQGLASLQKNQSHSAYLAYNLHSETQTVNVSGGYNFYRTPLLYSSSRQYSSFDNSDTLTEQVTRNHSHSAYGTFFYRKKFKNKATLRGTAFMQYSGNKYNRDYREGDIYATSLFADEDFYDVNAFLTYSQDFKNKSNLVIQWANFYKFTDISYVSENSTEEKLKNNETILYMLYTYPLGKKWTLMGRLGATCLTYLQTDWQRRTYFSPRPSISLQYRPSQTLYFYFNSYLGSSSPQLSHLNNTEQSIDRWQMRRGNPDLKRSLFWTTQLDVWAQLWGGQLQTFLKYQWSINNVINRTLYENDKYIQTYSSNGDRHQINLNLSYSKSIANCFNFNLSGGWEYVSFTDPYKIRSSEWYGSFSAAYYKKGFYAGIQGGSVRNGVSYDLWKFHSSAYLSPYIYYYWNGLSVMVYAQNPFWNHRNRQRLDTGIYQVESRSFNSRQDHYYGLRLTWNFSFGRKFKYSDDQLNNGRGSAIIQVEK